MNRDQIRTKIVKMVHEIARDDLPVNGVENDSTWSDLGMDSLDVVETVMDIEEEFDLDVPDDAWESVQGISDAVRLVEQLLERKREGVQ